MPAGHFRIRVADGTWLSHRSKTFPVPENRTAQISHPRPSKRSGINKPRGAFGKPEATVRFPACVGAAYLPTDNTLQRYADILTLYSGLADGDESVDVEVELRDERTEAWKTYTGYALWPTVGTKIQLPDGTNWYFDIEIRIINLVASGN